VIPLAVIKIKVLNVIGRMDELSKVTEALGSTRVFHPDNALSFYSNAPGFSPVNDTNPYAKSLSQIQDALKLIEKDSETSKLHFPEHAVLPVEDWEAYANNFSGTINEYLEKKNKLKAEIDQYKAEISKLQPFDALDVNFDELRSCRYVKFRFGSLPEENLQKLTESDHPLAIFIPSKNEHSLCWGVYCAPIGEIQEADRFFSSLLFEAVPLDEYSGTLKSRINELSQKIKQAKKSLSDIDVSIKNYWNQEKKTLLGVYTWLVEKQTYFDIRRYAARYGKSFILTGWIPADKEDIVRPVLDQLETVKYAFDDAEDPEVLPHSPPVQLSNKKLWKPFEFFVHVYGFPSYNEMDPTIVIALTYTVFFGFMFADLGQGLCVALVGLYLWKKRHSELGAVMIPCGIASAIVGTAFGSVFGFEDALNPFYQTVFGLKTKPISVMEQTSDVVTFSIGLGMFMVLIAILTNIIACLKRHQYTNGLFGPNGVAGFVFYSSVIFGFGGEILNKWHIISPAFIVCCIVLPLVLMLFREVLGGLMEGKKDWKPDSWVELIMQSFFEVFEFVLSYVTNTISFCRIGAYILVHAGMMMVIFTLAENTGIFSIFIIAFGNIFVIALEGLLSGIQALRLEFYEMFSRFYDGSGRPYKPVVVGQASYLAQF
jgi:V/A-type H+/Na+-transporting ATPase subunit I